MILKCFDVSAGPAPARDLHMREKAAEPNGSALVSAAEGNCKRVRPLQTQPSICYTVFVSHSALSSRRSCGSEMDEDDDTPPMLVQAEGADRDASEATLSADMEDVKIARVPITIITGRCVFCVITFGMRARQSAFLSSVLCL